ncbi:glycosyltransferase family 9 protein [Rhodocyclus tenuis]|uniref:glycosyltransferase family 9 protein n=1 Tax=Rhodocyclus tenuis TaxID=1066 RepID=UPI0019081FC4|nr:glycosyltransferase family 9 protein [Rhodocyclus tenuis]MBK1681817.1 hypothetical protein [Rhodocyclus tenuis]
MSRLISRLLTIGLAVTNSLRRRRPTASRPVRKILVAHHLLLGDTILLAPLLAKLAQRYPDAERVILCRPAVATLFSGRPYGFVAQPHDPRSFSSLREILAKGPFDIALVLGDNRYAWLARASGAKWIVGFEGDRPAWKNWMVDESHPHSTVPATWADMAAGLIDGAAPQAFRPGDWPAPAAKPPHVPGGPYAVLHVGASTPLKLWPAERWRALAAHLVELGVTPVWSVGPGETALVDEIDPLNQHPRHCGSLSLAQLWTLLVSAKLLICPDTGVAHLGKVVGVPTIALFGPGSIDIYGKGTFWRDAIYIALAEEPFPCRDQKLLFRRELTWVRRCGRSPSECLTPGACMQAIPLTRVKAAVDRLINCKAT